MAAVKTTRALYKYLMRETQKLPNDASKFYQTSVRNVSLSQVTKKNFLQHRRLPFF
jgi:hypothetical protein